MTVTKLPIPRCPYCEIAPERAHPGYSCPRISSIVFEEDGRVGAVEFIDWQEWLELQDKLREQYPDIPTD